LKGLRGGEHAIKSYQVTGGPGDLLRRKVFWSGRQQVKARATKSPPPVFVALDYVSVEGFKTIAQRKTGAEFMKRTHKPATIRSAALRLGARLRING
jgi:hypothetical protein